jgi:hypothetical protein
MKVGREHPETGRGSQLPGGFRIVLSLVGGLLAIGIIESSATIYSLLRFGLGGTNDQGPVYAASAIASSMFLASLLATMAVLGSSVSRYAWSIHRGVYIPMLSISIVIYGGMLLGGLQVDSASLYGELLIEKRLSVGFYTALAIAAALIGILRGAASEVRS